MQVAQTDAQTPDGDDHERSPKPTYYLHVLTGVLLLMLQVPHIPAAPSCLLFIADM